MVENGKEEYTKDSPHDSKIRMGRIGHCDWDLVTNVMVWSPGVYDIFQVCPYDGDTSHLIRFMKWFHADDRAQAQDLIWLALDSRRLQTGQYRVVKTTGSISTICLLAEPALDAAGRATHMHMTLVEL